MLREDELAEAAQAQPMDVLFNELDFVGANGGSVRHSTAGLSRTHLGKIGTAQLEHLVRHGSGSNPVSMFTFVSVCDRVI